MGPNRKTDTEAGIVPAPERQRRVGALISINGGDALLVVWLVPRTANRVIEGAADAIASDIRNALRASSITMIS